MNDGFTDVVFSIIICIVCVSVLQTMNLGQSPSTVPLQPVERDKIFQWILELSYLDTRENALLELRFYTLLSNSVAHHYGGDTECIGIGCRSVRSMV